MDYRSIITVLAGVEKESFVVHEASICARSPFFRAACSKEWKEGQTKVVELPEVEHEAFAVYVHWVYTREIDMTIMTERANTYVAPSFLNLTKMWLLADMLRDVHLCNCVNDGIIKTDVAIRTPGLNMASLGYIMEHTPQESTIRRLYIDMHLASLTRAWVRKNKDEIPRTILVEFALKYADGEPQRVKAPVLEDRCKYHSHGEGVEKCT